MFIILLKNDLNSILFSIFYVSKKVQIQNFNHKIIAHNQIFSLYGINIRIGVFQSTCGIIYYFLKYSNNLKISNINFKRKQIMLNAYWNIEFENYLNYTNNVNCISVQLNSITWKQYNFQFNKIFRFNNFKCGRNAIVLNKS